MEVAAFDLTLIRRRWDSVLTDEKHYAIQVEVKEVAILCQRFSSVFLTFLLP